LLLAEEEELVQMAVHVLSAVALYEAAGHRVVLTALEELYYFHCSAPAASSSAAQPFKLLVDELRKPRSRAHAHRLTLINAIVSGCPEIGTRVRMRNELADLDFIELTRPMMNVISGDEVETIIAIQIAVYDEEMRADLAEIVEMRADLAEIAGTAPAAVVPTTAPATPARTPSDLATISRATSTTSPPQMSPAPATADACLSARSSFVARDPSEISELRSEISELRSALEAARAVAGG